jgi:hypothetical protein
MSRTIRKYYDYNNSTIYNDRKPWFKPNKQFKTLAKKSRKAKEKEALRLDKEVIPEFPKEDVYNWS